MASCCYRDSVRVFAQHCLFAKPAPHLCFFGDQPKPAPTHAWHVVNVFALALAGGFVPAAASAAPSCTEPQPEPTWPRRGHDVSTTVIEFAERAVRVAQRRHLLPRPATPRLYAGEGEGSTRPTTSPVPSHPKPTPSIRTFSTATGADLVLAIHLAPGREVGRDETVG